MKLLTTFLTLMLVTSMTVFSFDRDPNGKSKIDFKKFHADADLILIQNDAEKFTADADANFLINCGYLYQGDKSNPLQGFILNENYLRFSKIKIYDTKARILETGRLATMMKYDKSGFEILVGKNKYHFKFNSGPKIVKIDGYKVYKYKSKTYAIIYISLNSKFFKLEFDHVIMKLYSDKKFENSKELIPLRYAARNMIINLMKKANK